MAWEISHSPIAWTIARVNLRARGFDSLLATLKDVEWSAKYDETGSQKTADTYADNFERDAHNFWDVEQLVDQCVEHIEKHNTCSNGGHEFYIDAEGYQSISVSLDPGAIDSATTEERDSIEVYAPEEINT